MKALKKVLCVTLALMLASLALIMPVSAAKDIPLVVVNGFASTPLVQNYGTEDQKTLFPPDDAELEALITKAVGAFAKGFAMYGIAGKDWDKLADAVLPIIKDYIEPIAYNTDGTPKYDNVQCIKYEKPMSAYAEEERESIFSIFGVKYGKTHGAKNVYSFNYDWRTSPIDCAKDLDTFIAKVKSETGASKVNVVAISQGSAVTLSYMAKYNCKNLNNVVFASPAWQGTSIAGNLFTGNIELDIMTMENFLVMLADGSAVTHAAAFLASAIATQEGLSHEYFGKINYALQQLLPRVYSDIVVPQLSGMPGVWCLVPNDYFEAAKKYLFPDGINADLEATINAYNKIQTNAKSIITNAESKGVHFGVVCGYNCQIAPINKEYPTSDMVIDTKYASGGAVCAKYLQAFDDWGANYTQAVKDDHYHISWDNKVDASSCMFPEQTWFLKNLRHVSSYQADNGTCDIVLWLLEQTKQVTVHTDTEKYPQFSLYNTYKNITTPYPAGGMLGDLDGSTGVTTKDARIALKIATGIQKATDDQLLLGDIDEDGKITTKDARAILRMAVGLDYTV